jgi:prevent-host-death family protein
MNGTPLGVRELQTKCGEIIRRVDRGERFTITFRNRPVADIVPLRRRRPVPFEEAVRLAGHGVPAPTGNARTSEENALTALIDTSVLDSDGWPGPLGHVIDAVAVEVSAITFGQLMHLALTADEESRVKRVATLAVVESSWDPLPVDGGVAREFGRLTAALQDTDTDLSGLDLFVAATASAHGIPVVTRHRGFEVLRPLGVHVIAV